MNDLPLHNLQLFQIYALVDRCIFSNVITKRFAHEKYQKKKWQQQNVEINHENKIILRGKKSTNLLKV